MTGLSTTGAADAKFAKDGWIRALQRTASIDEHPQRTLPVLIDEFASEFGASPALESREGSLSYAQLAARAHQYARWGLSQGLVAGDVAALLMPNCAEYVAVWLGLTRIGVTVSATAIPGLEKVGRLVRRRPTSGMTSLSGPSM